MENEARAQSAEGRNQKASVKLRAGLAQEEVERRELNGNDLHCRELD